MVTRLLGGDRTLARLAELLDYPGVTSKVLLTTDKDDGQTGAKVHDLGDPLE